MAAVDPSGVRAIVMYVLNPSSVTLNDLPWTVCCQPDAVTGKTVGFVVYRGQSSAPKGSIPRLGFSPNEIRLDMGRPLSTSSELNQHIESFAAPPGRLFLIHVTPGIKYINVKEYIGKSPVPLDEAYFKTILEALPPTSGFVANKKGTTAKQLAGEFWRRLAKEKEIILSPEGAKFQSETGPETWSRPEALTWVRLTEVYESTSKTKGTDGKPVYKSGQPTGRTREVNVYETGLFPAGSGRGRTFRRKAKRLNKNGRRSARQSRRHRNSHA